MSMTLTLGGPATGDKFYSGRQTYVDDLVAKINKEGQEELEKLLSLKSISDREIKMMLMMVLISTSIVRKLRMLSNFTIR